MERQYKDGIRISWIALPSLGVNVGHINNEIITISVNKKYYMQDCPFGHYEALQLFKTLLNAIVWDYELDLSSGLYSQERRFDAFVQRRGRFFEAVKSGNIKELCLIDQEIKDARESSL